MAGVAAAWTADLVPGDRAWRTAPSGSYIYARAGGTLTLVCGALGASADLDLLWGGHREHTHSVGAVLFVALFAAAMAVNARRPVVRVTLMCAGAYATHLLLDWLGADDFAPYGIRALWPFSDHWYISGLDVFRATQRFFMTRTDAIRANAIAIVQEILVLGPIAALLWLVRVEALAGLAAKLPRGDHAPQ
ncbi:MAG TPA: metal-dependent hydrolase [Vicinamibacterales bacterium]|nr:metal-dependent hydrolase [Vicinamibacterales bacterium]